jgi:hypothetical protein
MQLKSYCAIHPNNWWLVKLIKKSTDEINLIEDLAFRAASALAASLSDHKFVTYSAVEMHNIREIDSLSVERNLFCRPALGKIMTLNVYSLRFW